jgi:secreted trypsin-like serine protease
LSQVFLLPSGQRRILEDQFACQGDFPYQFALLTNGDYWCGGSIISNQYILIADHSVENFSPNELSVIHGSIYWPHGTVAEVSKIIAHEKYDKRKYDVALLRLTTPSLFDEFINAVLHKNPVPTDVPVVIPSFGSKHLNGGPSVLLKYQEMTIGECASEASKGFICLNSPRGVFG